VKIFWILIAYLGAAGAHAATDVNAIRIWAAPEYTRTVLDLSGAVEYKVFMLDNPARLVLDLQGISAKPNLTLAPGGLVQGLRIGNLQRGELRLVIDLNAAVKPKSFLLPPADRFGHRLVLDLYPSASANSAITKAPNKPTESDDERDIVIAIDAGHGGDDPGAIGPSGTQEKTVTLAMAKALAEKIDATPGYESLLIRDDDYYVALHDRFEKAREGQADLFVSIHADSFVNAKARGSSVFMMSQRGATNEAAKYLADRENRSDLVGGVSLDDKDATLAAVLMDLSQGATLEASEAAATNVMASIRKIGNAHGNKVQRANFVVLRSPDIPSMLIETAFISNPTEEKLLADRKHQDKLADAIFAGLKDYFSSAPPPGTWVASNAPRIQKHIVSRGETLSGIAVQYKVSTSKLREANNMPTDVVQIGRVLTIPLTSS
jgi:N-acetylmuramoyl-L-alanine amidase